MKHRNLLSPRILPAVLLLLAVCLALLSCDSGQAPVNSADASGGCWEQVPGPEIDAPLVDVTAAHAISASDIWAVGQTGSAGGDVSHTLAMHWDGAKWTVVPSPNGPNPDNGRNSLYAVSGSSGGDVWAVGAYTTGGSQFHTLAMHWNGTQWSTVPLPDFGAQGDQLNTVAALAPDNVWVAGSYLTSEHQDGHMLVLHWDGKAWSRSPLPLNTTHIILSLTARAPDDIWAVGTQAMHWNGKNWRILPTVEGAYFDGVTAVGPDDAWVVGDDGDNAITLHWDGQKLDIVPVPGAGSKAFLHETTALPNGDVWVAGEIADKPRRQPLLMKWAGEQWTLYPSPVPDHDARLQGITAADGILWAVGSQTQEGKSKPLFLRYKATCGS